MMFNLVRQQKNISFTNVLKWYPTVLNINHFRTSASDQQLSNFLPAFIRNRNKPNVAVINLVGLIQANMQGRQIGGQKSLNLESLEKSIDKAFDMKNLKEVCLVINSPGGSPVQSELIAKKIINLGEAKKVHVVSFVEDYAASGGYWLACAGKEIFAAENSVIGSIGVIYSAFGFHELIKNYGIDRRVYTAGKSKSLLDPFLPEAEKEVEHINKLLTSIHGNFISYIQQQRGIRLQHDKDELFYGKTWVGKEAAELGLIDGIDTLDNYVINKFGKEAKIVKVNPYNQSALASLFKTGADFSMIEDTIHQQNYRFL